MDAVFAATIDRTGNLTVTRHVEYRQHLLNIVRGSDSASAEVIVRKPRRKKTDRQRNYYWSAIVKELSDFTGHTPADIHGAMKTMFLSYEDKGVVYQRSTEDLTTAEAEDYYESIRVWAMDVLQVYLPLPNEVNIP